MRGDCDGDYDDDDDDCDDDDGDCEDRLVMMKTELNKLLLPVGRCEGGGTMEGGVGRWSRWQLVKGGTLAKVGTLLLLLLLVLLLAET